MTALAAAAGGSGNEILARVLPWLVGLAFAALFVPPGFLDGSAPLLLRPQGDFQQHQTAVLAYLGEPWQWPPFHIASVNVPQGTTLVFTDALPGPSFLAKIVQSLTGLSIPVLGWWLFLVYLLQPVAMARLLRAMGVSDWRPLLAGSLIALACSWFLARFGHTALNAHFLLLFALAFAIEAARPATARRALAVLALLSLAGLFVSAYLFAMVTAIGLAAYAGALLGGRIGWRAALAGPAAWGALVAGLMALLGYFAYSRPMWGYDTYSMNLLSPFVPQMSGLWPDFGRLLWLPDRPPLGDWRDISAMRPQGPMGDVVDATGGQYEGYAWFGFGLWPLLLVALALHRRRLPALLRRHWPLLLALLGMAFYALGPRVWVAYGPWFEVDFVPAAVTAFRSCGRFVWPLLYLGAAAAVAGVALAPGPARRWTLPLLALLTLVQLADARLHYDRLWRQLRADREEIFDPAVWRPFIALHETLVIEPPLRCATQAASPKQQLSLHAVSVGRASNSIYIARESERYCAASAVRNLFFGPPPGTLLVLLGDRTALQLRFMDEALRRSCREIAQGHACTPLWDEAMERGIAPR